MKPLNQNGFTIAEILVATAILSMAGTALTWSIQQLGSDRMKVKQVSHIVSVESVLVSALLDEKNYPPDVKQALRDGNANPTNLKFNLSGSSMGETFNFTIRPNKTVNLSATLQPCSEKSSTKCSIQLALGLARMDSRYRFAYRISTSDPRISLSFRGAGDSSQPKDEGSASPVFASSEYVIAIPTEFYLDANELICPPGTLAMRGMDAQSGQVNCIREPQKACPNGRLAKQILYDSGTNSFELDCGTDTQTVSCPDNYYLNTVDTRSLDTGATKSGRCVFAARSPAAPIPSLIGPANRIQGRLCPPGYRSSSTCRIAASTITNRAGSCPWCYGTGSDCANATTVEDPIATFTKTIPFMCTVPGGLTVNANPGRAVMIENSPKGSVDCWFQKAQQDCGAVWNAQVELVVNCVLDGTPEFVNAN